MKRVQYKYLVAAVYVVGLFMDLLDDSTDAAALDFPVVYASAKAGRASLEQPADGGLPDSEDLVPLFQTILDTVPAPTYTEDARLDRAELARAVGRDAGSVAAHPREGPCRRRCAARPCR